MRPDVLSRVKERRQLSRGGIERAKVRSLVSVAEEAGERKVAFVGFAAMLAGDDVVWLVLLEGKGFREEAVLTARTGPLPDPAAQSGRDAHQASLSAPAAWALRSLTIFSIFSSSSSLRPSSADSRPA